MLKRVRLVHYDRVVAIDTEGDCAFPGPHVLVELHPQHGLFEAGEYRFIACKENYFDREFVAHDKNRVEFFPKSFRLDDPNASGG
jgi:hypothetical protein